MFRQVVESSWEAVNSQVIFHGREHSGDAADLSGNQARVGQVTKRYTSPASFFRIGLIASVAKYLLKSNAND